MMIRRLRRALRRREPTRQLREDPCSAQLENTTVWVSHTHHPDQCAGNNCTIHNRSDHHMRSWPQHWRGDRGIMERICPDNGIGHPDPDEINPDGVHGCDGCCAT